MQIDRVLFPITSLGPGERLVIWTVGCSKHCYNCANPELWQPNPTKEAGVYHFAKALLKTLKNKEIDGITVTGGDPFEQKEQFLALLSLLTNLTDDILVYTGFTFAELKKILSKSELGDLKKYVSVLIDGPYIDTQNDNECVLRGSNNQNIIYFDKTKQKRYEEYMKNGRTIQNVFYNDKMISVGIHNKETIL